MHILTYNNKIFESERGAASRLESIQHLARVDHPLRFADSSDPTFDFVKTGSGNGVPPSIV